MSQYPASNLDDKILPKVIDLPQRPVTAAPHARPKREARAPYDYAYDLRTVPLDEGFAKMAAEFWR